MRYLLNSELENLGKRLIDTVKDHENLKMLKIGYMFRDEAPVSDGRCTAGMAIHVDDRNWAIHKLDALIEISRDIWEAASPQFREALMDHELSHLQVVMEEEGTPAMDEGTGRLRTRIRKHDIEEFASVLKRHGAYHENLRDFLDAFAKRKEEQKKAKKAGMTGGTPDQD